MVVVGIEDCGGPNESHEHVLRRRTQVIYTEETIVKKLFMEDLKLFRDRKKKKMMKKFIIEPNWYQVLSENQRKALKTLDACIYEDIIEGRPIRTKSLLRYIGLYDLPKRDILMTCLYLGKRDSKILLTQVFLNTYNHPFDQKRENYDLNAKTIMSSILFLGIDHIIKMLHERLRPTVESNEWVDYGKEEKPKKSPPKKIVSKQSSVVVSPYLQKPPPAVMYSAPAKKKFKPLPLPSIDDLEVEPEAEEEVHEEQVPVFIPPAKKEPPETPSLGRRRKPGKVKISPSMCDEIAGIYRIQPHHSVEAIPPARQSKKRKSVKSGLPSLKSKKPKKRKVNKLPTLKSDRWNKQYLITGIAQIRGTRVYILGSMVELPPLGDIAKGGGVRIDTGEVISIIEGIRGYPPTVVPEKCDCMEKWNSVVIKYLNSHRCTCGHYYDFGHEGEFPEDITPFFVKPTRFRPYYFNYDHIFELDEKRLLVTNEFDRFVRDDSLLNLDQAKKKKKKPKKSKDERAVKGYLEYLRVALQTLRKYDVAAKLPELYLVPELRAWMRKRVKGPLTRKDRQRIISKSDILSQLFHKIYTMAFWGHINPNLTPKLMQRTTWRYAPTVKKNFARYVQSYKKKMFLVQMDLVNRFWATLYQADWPDKSFRNIFFSYCIASLRDVLLVNPYDPKAAVERQTVILSRGYKCPIRGNADAKTS